MDLHRLAAGSLLLLLSACSSDSNAPADQNGPARQQDISNVIYVGGPNDEALLRFLDIAPKRDARRTVVVESPDLSAPVSKDNPITFQFHFASQAQRTPQPPPANAAAKWQRGFHELLQFLAPERIAHAHGVPFNGTAYYLVITDKNAKPILQVFTAETSFTPEAVDFQHLVDAPQPLTLTIDSADFDNSAIPADGGPFVGGSFPLRIE